MAGSIFSITYYSQTVLGLSAFMTGLILLPMTLGIFIFSILAPKLVGRFTHKTIMVVGFVISMIGCLILAKQFTFDVTFLDVLLECFLFGAGLGFPLALEVEMTLAYVLKKVKILVLVL